MTYMIDSTSFKGDQLAIVQMLLKTSINFDPMKDPLGDFYERLVMIEKWIPLPDQARYQYATLDYGGQCFVLVADGFCRTVIGAIQLKYIMTRVYQEFHVALLPQYRGKGLGLAMYGVIFTIMRVHLMSGDTQTPDGYNMWLNLSTIPGISIEGVARTDRLHKVTTHPNIKRQYRKYTVFQIHQDDDARQQLFDSIEDDLKECQAKFHPQDGWYLTFPVEIVNNEFTSKHFKMKETSDTFMLATFL